MRIEKDTMGNVEVEDNVFWGAQTQRSLNNFRIGNIRMPQQMIMALAIVKKSAAYTNAQLGVLSENKKDLIAKVCDEIIQGKCFEDFHLLVWQTGSGTQTNMNVNEVIANRAEILNGGNLNNATKYISANDDVNKSQSTNDVFPTAMRIAFYKMIVERTIPALEQLKTTFAQKKQAFAHIIKIGRTHLMDATPLRLGDEFSAYESQMDFGIQALKNSLVHLQQLPIGGTAVGTGLNTPKGYDKLVVDYINQFSGHQFYAANNKYEGMATHDAFVETSSALKQIAISLTKIANDIRLLSSGPRCGLGELNIPQNEPGSSIMPGKVNPTQCEAMTMVSAQIVGNDTTIAFAAMQGHLQLNVFMPVIAYNALQSAELLAECCHSFNKNCIEGIEANTENIEKHLQESLMLVTALNPHIGYYNAAKIAQYAFANKLTLKEAALKLNLLTAEEFDEWVQPDKMV